MNNNNPLDIIDPDTNYFTECDDNFESFSIETLNSSNILKEGTLNIMHHNARSILSEGRMDDYEHLFGSINNSFHVLAFTESWLKQDNFETVKFNGYNSCHMIRPINMIDNDNSQGGGISVFVQEHISFKVRDDLNVILPFIETLFIEFIVNDKKYMLGTVYRRPNTNSNTFIDYLDGLIEPFKSSYEIIIMGDFNICMLQDNNISRYFVDRMHSNALFPTILEATRVATVFRNGEYHTTETLIDNIFINKQLKYKSGLLHLSISDHYPIFISICQNVKSNQNTENFIKFRNINDESIAKFYSELESLFLESIKHINESARAFTLFYTKLNELYEKHFPIIIKPARKKELANPWVTPILARHIKIKHNLGRLANKGRIDRAIFKRFRNKVTNELKKAKLSYYSNKFSDYKGDMKKTWGTINERIRKRKLHNKISLIENDSIINETEIPNKFCDYFTSIAEKLVSDIPVSQTNHASYLRNRIPNSFFITPINNEEIGNAISDLKDNGCGLYKLSTKVLIAIKPILCKILEHIFNLCINQGYFPGELKVGCLTPVFKKGDKLNIENYRPICSLSPLSKIFERIIYDKMLIFIDKNQIFSESQFGFRKKMSTETAIMKFMDYVHSGLYSKHYVGSIFMDLSKAFDVMNHGILKHKLEHYGFRGIFLDFMMQFVQDRRYFVNANGQNSEVHNVNIGVPQGSTLGPLLFLIYVNDMKNSSSILKFIQFADDTTILFNCSKFDVLKSTLEAEGNKVVEWLVANKLLINLTKTQSMLFTFKRHKPLLSVKLNDIVINEQENVTFLGVVIDHKLNWKAHISHICSKVSKSIAILRLLKFIFPKEVLKMLYMSLIYSYLNYCNLIWGSAEDGIIQPLFILQKKAIRIITKSHYLDHTAPIFKSLEILTLCQMFQSNCLLFAFKCINCNLFPYYRNKICQNLNIHTYNTRNNDNFRTNQEARLRIIQRSYLHNGINLWNSLDSWKNEYYSISSFKKRVKSYMLEQL